MRPPLRSALVGALALSTLAGGLLTAPAAFAAGTTTIVAGPSGGGSDCTAAVPCSLGTAQEQARAASAAGNTVDVQLRGGQYVLSQTFQLGPQDSGTAAAPVTYEAYPSEQPVLTSATTIGGWTDAGNGALKANTGGAEFRQLYVDGQRATPARWPNDGSYVEVQQYSNSAKTISILTSQYQQLGNDLNGMEALLETAWGESYLRVTGATTNASNPTLTDLTFGTTESDILFQRPFPGLAQEFAVMYFQNARSFVDTPGEFSVDRAADTVYYLPRPGEDLQADGAQVPTLDTLLDVSGTDVDTPVHDISVSGISFQYTNWTRATTDGLLNAQGGLYNLSANMQNQQYVDRPPAAVHSSFADRVSFSGNTFTHLGSTALDLDTAVHDSSATGNVITDVSGNGIMVGKFSDPDVEYHVPYQPTDPRVVTSGVSVTNNVVTGTGRDYYGTAGINAGYVSETHIDHNDVSDSPWAGISLGWGWTDQVTALGNNSVSFNRVSNVINELCDTAAIYHLSRDNGTVIEGNYIHDVRRTPTACIWPISPVYLDEGSNGMTVRNNVLADVDGGVLDKGYSNQFSNNVGADKGIVQGSGLESGYRALLDEVNIARGKPATSSSSYGGGFAAGSAVDGNLGTGWSPTSADSSPWWQVDLGAATTVAQVSLTFRQNDNQPETRNYLQVQASNDPTFATYTVVASRNADQSVADAGTWTAQVTDHGAYRYVRVAKTDGKYAFLTEVSIQAGSGVVGTPTVPTFDPTKGYTLTNVGTGRVAAIAGDSATQDTADGQTDQQWNLVPVSGNLFAVVNVSSGKALDNYGSVSRSFGVYLWERNGKNNQLWSIEPRGNAYVLRNANSGQLLEVPSTSSGAGAQLDQYADVSEAQQLWTIAAAGAATVTPTLTSASAVNAAGWYTSPVTVALAVSGTGATVQSRTAGTATWTTAASVQVTAQGSTTVEYRAVRNGQPVDGSTGQVTVTLDSVAPVTAVTTSPASGTAPVGQTATATFAATDATSGVARSEYSTDNGATWTTATAAGVSFTAPGSHPVQYRSVDVAGNAETIRTVTLTVAATNTAQVSVTSAGAPSPDGWYNQNVLVRLTAPQAGQKVQYRINGGSWRGYSSAVSVSANGTTTLDHRLLSSNVVVAGSEGQVVVKIDKTAPAATATRTPQGGTGTPLNPIAVQFAATDALSGVSAVLYQVNGGNWQPAPANQVSFGTAGDYVVTYVAVDNASNVSTVRSLSFSIQPNAQTRIATTSSSVRQGTPVTFVLTGFARWDQVTVSFAGSPLATIMTDQNGNARVTARIPAQATIGATAISATGTDPAVTASGQITVRR